MLVMAVLFQCSGINAINIYSVVILEEIPEVPITVGVLLLSFANVIGAGLSPLMIKVTTIRRFIIAD
jgi:hypothetical protein